MGTEHSLTSGWYIASYIQDGGIIMENLLLYGIEKLGFFFTRIWMKMCKALAPGLWLELSGDKNYQKPIVARNNFAL